MDSRFGVDMMLGASASHQKQNFFARLRRESGPPSRASEASAIAIFLITEYDRENLERMRYLLWRTESEWIIEIGVWKILWWMPRMQTSQINSNGQTLRKQGR